MSFRQFGGLKYASKHNVVSSNLNASNQLFVTQNVGQPNSIIDFLSDISGNITIYGNIDISGNENINGNLTVDGNETVLGNVDISGNATANYMFLSSGIDYATQNNAVMPKSYIDLVAGGINVAGKVYAVSTVAIDLSISQPNLIVDSISIPQGSYILLVAQSSEVDNGAYLYNTSNYLVRDNSTSVLPTGSDAVGSLVLVLNGLLNAKSGWLQTYKDPSTEEAIVGTNTLNFVEFYSLNFKTGNGLITTEVNNTNYISVDPSLNYMYAIDGSSNVLQLGTRATTTGLNFGSQSNQIPISFNGNPYTYSPYSVGSVISPPTFTITPSYGSTQITFTWTIPGTINSSIPTSLQQLNAVLYANINVNGNNTIKTYPILQNYTNNLSTINKLIISPFSNSNVSSNTYFYYNSDFANLTDSSSNILLLWYSNYGPYPNVCNVAYATFSSTGPPSIVLFNSPSQPSSYGFNSLTLPVYVQYTDASNNQTGPPYITEYDISYNSLYSTHRYGTQISQSTKIINVTNLNLSGGEVYNLIFGINPLLGSTAIYPDCSYNFSVTAFNGSSYGPPGSITYYTEPPAYPSYSIPNPLFNSSGLKYTNQLPNYYFVSNPSQQVQYDIININLITTNSPWISNQMTVPVQTQNNLGSTGSIILDVSCNISHNNIVTTASQNIYGFPASAYNPSGTSIDLSSNTIDNYNNSGIYNQGFYLDCSTNMIIRSSYFPSTFIQNKYLYTATLTMAQVNQSAYLPMNTYNTSYNFYADNINSSPTYNSLGGFTINNNINNNYYSALVSGIYVLNQSPTFNVTDLSLNNMGDYFYASPLVQYSSTGGVSITASETNLIHVNSGSITVDGSFNNTISITNPSISSTISALYNTQISLDISLNNLNSSSYYSSIATLNVIVDVSSNLLASSLTSLSSLGANPTLGYRVWSAPVDYGETMTPSGIVPFVYITSGSNIPNNTTTGSTPSGNDIGYVDVSYNNIWNISANSLANEELLIAAGNFTTNNNYYLKYSDASGNGNLNSLIDYTSLSGTKFATFAWNISNINPNPYNQINFKIYFTSSIYQNTTTGFYYLDSNKSYQLLLFYRFELNEHIGEQAYWGSPGGVTFPNTTWISINSETLAQTINTSTICDFGNKNNIYWNTASLNSPPNTNPPTPPYTFTTTLPTINLNTNATLYLRIGIPNDVSNSFTSSFSNVYAYLS